VKRKYRPPQPPPLADGLYLLRVFVPLRGGHYHHSWELTRVVAGTVHYVGSDRHYRVDAPVLRHARWYGPIQPHVSEAPTSSLARDDGGGRQRRRNRRYETLAAEEQTQPDKVLTVAWRITAAFVEVSDDLRAMYADSPDKLEEVIRQVAGLVASVRR
jgi:hypothetical protein